MKLGHNSTPFHLKSMTAASKDTELFFDYLVLDVYELDNTNLLDDRIAVEVLFVHRVGKTYFQTIETIAAPSIYMLKPCIKMYVKIIKPKAFMEDDIHEVRQYPTLQDLYLHAVCQYGATSLKVKLKQLKLL